jgi:hypothetical protein
LQVALPARMLSRAIGEQVDGDAEQKRFRIAQREQMLAALQAQVAFLRDVVGVRSRQPRADEAQQLCMRSAAQLQHACPAQTGSGAVGGALALRRDRYCKRLHKGITAVRCARCQRGDALATGPARR